MTRIPSAIQAPHTTPVLSESPRPIDARDLLSLNVHAVIKDLQSITLQTQQQLPSDFVGKLTLKLLAVQRSFRGGAFGYDQLSARRDLWQLQSALTSTPHPGLKDTAISFSDFVEQQDSKRVIELAGQISSASHAQISPPLLVEVQAIAEHSPSGHAQAVARDLLKPSVFFESQSPTPINSVTSIMQSTPLRGSTATNGRPGGLRRSTTQAQLAPGTPPSQAVAATSFVAPVVTRKIKLLPEFISRVSVAELKIPYRLKIRKLECAHGATYWMSQTQTNGSFGKFRRGVDQDGRRVGIKEIRLKESAHGEYNLSKGTYRTYVTTPEDLAKEVRLMRTLGGRVKLHDMVPIDGKVYLVMTDMAGGLDVAIKKIGVRDRRCVVRNVVAQCSEQMATLHDVMRHAHLDLKLQNVLLDDDGHVVPIDFGKSLEIDEDHRTSRYDAGTYPSPEMAFQEHVGAPSDVWALAVLYIVAHDRRYSPSFDYKFDGDERIGQTTRFVRFHQSLTDPKTGAFDMLRINPVDGGFGSMFSHLRLIDPKASHFVLSRMLDPDSKTRATMAETHAFFKALHEENADLQAKSTAALRSAAKEIGGVGISQAISDLREWDLARQSKRP